MEAMEDCTWRLVPNFLYRSEDPITKRCYLLNRTPVIEEEQSSTLDGASRYGSKRASLSGSQLMKLSWTIATRIVGWMRSKMEPLILVALFAGFVHLGQRKMERRRQQLLTYLVVCMGLRWYYHHYHKKHPKHS
jgi:hypothetical protein